MSNQNYEISPSSAGALYNAFFPGSEQDSDSERAASKGVPLKNVPARDDEILSCRVEVDPVTRVCAVTGTKLQQYGYLHAEERERLRKDFLDSVREQSSQAVEHLGAFENWLRRVKEVNGTHTFLETCSETHINLFLLHSERKGFPFTVILGKCTIL